MRRPPIDRWWDHERLSGDQAAALGRRLRDGLAGPEERERIRDTLVRQVAPLAIQKARRIAQALSLKDTSLLESAALHGVAKAVDTWDPDRGALTTHAAWLARGAMTSLIRDHKTRERRLPRDHDYPLEHVSATPDPYDDNEEAQARARTLRSALDRLGERYPRDREIVEALHFSSQAPTYSQLGRQYGLCRSRIQQLYVRALERLREDLADRITA